MRCKPHSLSRHGWIAACLLASLVLPGCSKKDEATTATNSQIVGRVGDQVISVQELDTELRWNNAGSDQKHDDAVVKRVLGDLVTRKYMLQQALAAKLDREPTVLLDILRSKELVLARAYAMRELARQASAVSAADIERYIADHPMRFAQRKILTVAQISPSPGSVDQAVIDSVRNSSSIDDVERRLKDLGIAYTRSSASVSTSDVPDEFLRSIQNKKPGEVSYVRLGPNQNGSFVSVTKEEARPLEGEAAMALARQLKLQDLAKAQASLASFSANAEAKFEGEYAKIMSETPANATN